MSDLIAFGCEAPFHVIHMLRKRRSAIRFDCALDGAFVVVNKNKEKDVRWSQSELNISIA
jgi:hypothetical protein